jgi:hypothetical protein
MGIDEIRQQLANKIGNSPEWIDKLNESEPGHYGVIDSEVNITKDNIWVNIPEGTFTFKNATYNFKLQMMASTDGIEDSFSKEANGSGSFRIKGNAVLVDELTLAFELDLYAE